MSVYSLNKLYTSKFRVTIGFTMESAMKISRKVSSSATKSEMSDGGNIVSVDFEVFGKVQGVFFRKYTQSKGASLGLRGWCENTPRGTVVGQLEGPKEQVGIMKNWLKNEGSPKSRISHCVFKNEQTVQKYTFTDFTVRR